MVSKNEKRGTEDEHTKVLYNLNNTLFNSIDIGEYIMGENVCLLLVCL